MGTCGPVARSLVVALGLEDTPPLEQGARHPPLLGTHRSFQLPGNPRTQRLGLRRFSGSPGAALPEAGVDWAGSQYFWAWALFFFFLQVLFYQWFRQKNKLKPRGQHVLCKTCSCPERETVAAQRPNFWSSLFATANSHIWRGSPPPCPGTTRKAQGHHGPVPTLTAELYCIPGQAMITSSHLHAYL